MNATVYRVVTMNGIDAKAGQAFADAEKGFIRHAEVIMRNDAGFMLLNNTYIATAKFISHTICGMSGVDIMNDPVRWLSGQTGMPRQDIISLLGLRLFMTKGTGNYPAKNFFGSTQTRQIQYSVAYYFNIY